MLTKLRKLPGVTEVKSEELRASEFPGFVTAEVRHHGATIDKEAATFLVSAVGPGPAVPGGGRRPAHQRLPRRGADGREGRKYFGGRAEAKSFAVADAAFWGRRRVALEELRWAIDGGTAPVLVTSAFAGSARGVARYKAAPRGMREADLAREVGVPPWKLRTSATSPAAGPTGRSPARSAPSPRPTPTSRARPATRRTRSSGWC